MHYRQSIFRLVVVSALLSILTIAVHAQQKKRLAVTDFEYQEIVSSSKEVFKQGGVNVGRGVTNVLIDRLVKSGLYTIVERKELDRVISELKLNNSDLMDKESSARVGKLVGADVLVYGSITNFGPERKGKDSKIPLYGDIKKLASKDKAVVTLTFRMVSAETAEILFVGETRGESANKGNFYVADQHGNVAEINMLSTDFGKTIIGEAVYDAVGKLVSELEGKYAKLPTRKIKVEGYIAKVDGEVLTITLGGEQGIRPGDRLRVSRIKGVIKHPVSGEKLGYDLEKIGEVIIDDVQDKLCKGSFVGKGPLNTKDFLITGDN